MAHVPYFAISPNGILSLLGLLRGPDQTVPTPADDWQEAKIDVVIPALNEERNILLCLESIAKQTLRPERVILVDDGSHDKTAELAEQFAKTVDLELLVFRRKEPIGKTPTLKRQAREFDSDVEFILDGDTILDSENYIERTVQELYQGVGIACACGTILPLRDHDRRKLLQTPALVEFVKKHSVGTATSEPDLVGRLEHAITNLYRSCLYLYLQRFVYHGQMVFFGTIINPVGCAVAYRRKYLKELFDRYEPEMGDDLTNSEDIFIGFALLAQGYRNIQLSDVYARSMEPRIRKLPKQIYFWSSSFLQSCFYFDELVRGPLYALHRWWKRRQERKSGQEQEIEEMRTVREAYRQPFGLEHTRQHGRPMAWVILMSAFEKVSYPAVLCIMAILGYWEMLGLTILIESIISVMILFAVSKGQRLEMAVKAILVTPVRYLVIVFDAYTLLRFAMDLWITRDRRWRK